MSGCVLHSVSIVGDIVGFPIAFCIALVPGLNSAFTLCAVSCLICVCCMVHSSLVCVVCLILAVDPICCTSWCISDGVEGCELTWRGL